MLDQMYTAENLRQIFDVENRKGLDLAGLFFPDLQSYTSDVHDKVQEIRTLRKAKAKMAAGDFEKQLTALQAHLADLKAKKSSAIDECLESISKKIQERGFKIELSQKTGPKGKPVFCIDGKPETFFVIKLLQRNIHRIYGIKQANRHDLICQLRDILVSEFPFEIVRTDISSFYESIDRKRLLEKFDHDQLLSPMSKKYIKQILDSYYNVSGKKTGIPRGVGISAYLAELYLRQVDQRIRSISGLVLYCRYVDDIVAVFARPPTGENLGSFKDKIIKILGDDKLTHNKSKTLEFSLNNGVSKDFSYLGYHFHLEGRKLTINPSEAKIEKYCARMKAAFADYQREEPFNRRKAFRKLVGRIKFLTGNTRLSNSKSRATTGIYFNNSAANDLLRLESLDKQLEKLIGLLERPSLQKKLEKLKFTTGFQQRRYHNFSTKELQMIVRVWKHG